MRRAGIGLVALGLLAIAGAAAGGDSNSRTCHGKEATIIGTPGADNLKGTKERDVVVLGHGDDRFEVSGSGADLVCAGRGDDRMEGHADSDRLWGQGGDDILIGGGHADLLRGGTGKDFLFGSIGTDRCMGGAPTPDGKRSDKAYECESVTSANRPGAFGKYTSISQSAKG